MEGGLPYSVTPSSYSNGGSESDLEKLPSSKRDYTMAIMKCEDFGEGKMDEYG